MILYADRPDGLDPRHRWTETIRRREAQEAYNEEHGITPKTVVKQITSLQDSIWDKDYVTVPPEGSEEKQRSPSLPQPRAAAV